MALHWHVDHMGGRAQLWVAAGTAFLHILVWHLPWMELRTLRRSAGGDELHEPGAMAATAPSSGMRRRGGGSGASTVSAAAVASSAGAEESERAAEAAAAAQRGALVSAALRRGSNLTHAAAGAVLEQRLAAAETSSVPSAADASGGKLSIGGFGPGVTKESCDRHAEAAAAVEAITRPPLLRLDGHEGSIHRHAMDSSVECKPRPERMGTELSSASVLTHILYLLHTTTTTIIITSAKTYHPSLPTTKGDTGSAHFSPQAVLVP